MIGESQDESETSIIDVPRHIAILLKNGHNALCPYNFIFFGRDLIYHARGFSG